MQKEMKIKFPKDRKLVIMQVSDPQDMYVPRSAMLKMLGKAYDWVQPDLVVFTGDNILGNHIDDAIAGPFVNSDPAVTEKRVDIALRHILNPLDKRKIPYCMVYGNHDDKNRLSKQQQAEYYLKHEFFIGLNSEDEDVECDTYNLPIYDSNGEHIAYNLWMIDSAGADEEGHEQFVGVKPETVEWYKRQSNKLKAQNGGKPVMSLMFQHVPLKETESLFIDCDRDDPMAVESKIEEGRFMKLDPSKADGYAYEFPSTCEIESGELEAIKKQGDVAAIVFGHDHLNCFTAEIDGVKIIQSPGASFRCYGNKTSRGIRVFEIDEKDTSKFSTYVLSFYDLMGKSKWTDLRYMMSADETEGKRNMVWAAMAVLGTAAVTGLVRSHKKRKKNK